MQQNAQNGIFSRLDWRNFGGIKSQSSVYSQFNTYSSKKQQLQNKPTQFLSPPLLLFIYFLLLLFLPVHIT